MIAREAHTSALSVAVGSLRLQNPVMPASGTFGYGREYADMVALDRLGALVTKAISLEPRLGNAPQRIYETDRGMLNSIGLQNPGVQCFVAEYLPFLREQGPPVVGNIVGTTVAEYAEVVACLERHGGLDVYELNLSCPNVAQGCLEFGQNAEGISAVLERVRQQTDRPLWVKLSPNVADIRSLGEAAQAAGAEALVAINTLLGMAIDVRRRRPVLSRGAGGLSGPAIRPVAVRMVFQLAAAVDIPVIGVGGIMTTEDVLEFLMAGATAVQVGTANFVDPGAMEQIIDGLQAYVAAERLTRLDEIVGAAHTAAAEAPRP